MFEVYNWYRHSKKERLELRSCQHGWYHKTLVVQAIDWLPVEPSISCLDGQYFVVFTKHVCLQIFMYRKSTNVH